MSNKAFGFILGTLINVPTCGMFTVFAPQYLTRNHGQLRAEDYPDCEIDQGMGWGGLTSGLLFFTIALVTII